MDQNERIKGLLKRCWGIYPLLVVLLCVATVAVIQTLTGDTLRRVPRIALIEMGIVCFGVVLLWISVRVISKSFKLRFLGAVLKIVTPILAVLVFVCVCFASQMALALGDTPEEIVMHQGTKAVAWVDDSDPHEVYMNYYQYKNVLFYGALLDREHLYG